MKKKFRRDYGVYCCNHVFLDERPILLAIRDPDGYWQFLCGEDDDAGDCHLVGIGHLLDRDPSLDQMADLAVASGAERSALGDDWSHFELSEASGP